MLHLEESYREAVESVFNKIKEVAKKRQKKQHRFGTIYFKKEPSFILHG